MRSERGGCDVVGGEREGVIFLREDPFSLPILTFSIPIPLEIEDCAYIVDMDHILNGGMIGWRGGRDSDESRGYARFLGDPVHATLIRIPHKYHTFSMC